jgi:hypothetical protein
VSAAYARETHLFYKEKVNRFIHQNKQRPGWFTGKATFATTTKIDKRKK